MVVAGMAASFSYIIGTGAWWTKSGVHPGSLNNESARVARLVEFFPVWYHFVNSFTSPEKIIIVDSASPVRPKFPKDKRLERVRLMQNFGHSTVAVKKLCGYTRAFFTGAFYALMNSVDYYVFIEQDCLVFGHGWLEHAVEAMGGAGISFGYFPNCEFHSENSLAIVHRDSILPAIEVYLSVEECDSKVYPEMKFDKIRESLNYTPLPFGYGRDRPINFSDEFFYAQHLTWEELHEMLRRGHAEIFLNSLPKEEARSGL